MDGHTAVIGWHLHAKHPAATSTSALLRGHTDSWSALSTTPRSDSRGELVIFLTPRIVNRAEALAGSLSKKNASRATSAPVISVDIPWSGASDVASFSSTGYLPESLGTVHDTRCEEDHELAARVRSAASLKEQTKNRYVPEEGHLVEVAAGVSREDATDHRGMSVHDQQVSFCFAFQDGRSPGRSLVKSGSSR